MEPVCKLADEIEAMARECPTVSHAADSARAVRMMASALGELVDSIQSLPDWQTKRYRNEARFLCAERAAIEAAEVARRGVR